ncbi:MAG: ribokinase [Spirochaetaceae bacterium]|nr:ribokinase [Spirochaetaceae bacterium]
MNQPTVIHNAGSLNIDDVFRTTHIVRPGETIPSRTLDRYPGGKGLNQSTALARAGAFTRHIGRIGEDGVFLKNDLAADGADVSGIAVGDVPTGHAIIQVADDGENAIVLFGGANQDWGTGDIERVITAAKPGDVLLLQNEINGMAELMDAAAAAGMRLALNPAPMGPEVQNYPLEKLSWLVVNEIEGQELSGFDDDELIVTELQRRYPDTVVVLTLGKKGAIRADKNGLIRSSFPDVGPVVDTTGAGDTFMGYWLAGEVAGMESEACLRRACAAGALAVTRPGATTGIPVLAEVEVLL